MQSPNTKPHDLRRDLAESTQFFVQQFGHQVASLVNPFADAHQTKDFEVSEVKPYGRVQEGTIEYSLPTYGSARVKLSDGSGIIRCRLGSAAGYELGAQVHQTYPHGTHVYVYVDYAEDLGTILCSKPPLQPDAADAFADSVVQGSSTGVYNSPQYTEYIEKLSDGGGLLPFAGDAPIDQIPGDYEVMAATGVGLHVDADMAYLRTSELCGVFLFREDGHTRVSGESISVESPACREEHGIAYLECYREAGESIYPWETFGQIEPDDIELIENTPEVAYSGEQARLEPAIDRPPICRIDEFGGYLGQGRMLTVSAPQEVPEGNGPATRYGLFREQVMIDGTYIAETANQMYFAKVSDVPVLTRRADRGWGEGDKGYAFNGNSIGGPEHIVKQLRGENESDPSFAAEEMYAYASGWLGLNAAAYNPDISLDYRPVSWPNHTVADLSQSDHVPLPGAETVRVDHRTDIEIQRVLSLFAFLPDGGVVIQNGQGAQIRLAQGVTEISGTGVYLNAGKTLSLMAGQISLRSQKSTELVSSTGAVRIKAETDLLMLAGNAGYGGVMIESRARSLQSKWEDNPEDSQAAGITLKSPNGHIGLLGGDVLVKTGPSVAGHRNGIIVLDAGNQQIFQRASTHNRFSQTGYYDNFGTGPDNIQGVNVWHRSYGKVSGSMGVSEQLIVGKMVQAGRGYTTVKGHYASTEGERYGYRVGVEIRPQIVEGNIAALREQLDAAKDYGQRSVEFVRDNMEAEDRPLNPDVMKATSFGFPSSQGYGAGATIINQPLWQRVHSVSSIPWREPVVKYQDNDAQATRPWPGNDTWNREGSFRQSDGSSQYFDTAAGHHKSPKNEATRKLYEEATLPSTSLATIADGLLTIR